MQGKRVGVKFVSVGFVQDSLVLQKGPGYLIFFFLLGGVLK